MHDAKIVLIYAICTTGKGIFGGRDAGQTLARTLNGPCLGRRGNFKMCRGNARSPNTVSWQICKKVVPQLIDPGENILPFHCDFCDTSRTAEASSTRKKL